MATNSMAPSISQAPLGLGLMDIIEDNTPDVEILIENADGVEVGIDGREIWETSLALTWPSLWMRASLRSLALI